MMSPSDLFQLNKRVTITCQFVSSTLPRPLKSRWSFQAGLIGYGVCSPTITRWLADEVRLPCVSREKYGL
jgi:hypothetical protein